MRSPEKYAGSDEERQSSRNRQCEKRDPFPEEILSYSLGDVLPLFGDYWEAVAEFRVVVHKQLINQDHNGTGH
jgi:hypothetical protein